jgi:pimeloyl-ACP methyl ester carboxylesterase
MKRNLVTLLIGAWLTACSNPPYPRQASQPPLEKWQGLAVMRVAGAGQTPLVFIHGSPGDWQAWSGYLQHPQLHAYGDKIAVDRPGFGQSTLPLMPALRAQAAALAAALPVGKKSIVVGHSLGGPLAFWLAIDHPDQVCGVVSVAGSLAADLEAPRWYNTLADTWLARWLVSKELMQSNQEMLVLQDELRLLSQHWQGLKAPTVLVQGETDELVLPETAQAVKTALPQVQVLMVKGQGHFVLWEQPEVVVKAILGLPCAP